MLWSKGHRGTGKWTANKNRKRDVCNRMYFQQPGNGNKELYPKLGYPVWKDNRVQSPGTANK